MGLRLKPIGFAGILALAGLIYAPPLRAFFNQKEILQINKAREQTQLLFYYLDAPWDPAPYAAEGGGGAYPYVDAEGNVQKGKKLAIQPPPRWLILDMPRLLNTGAWEDPDQGTLSEAKLWQAPIAVLYNFFETTQKVFPSDPAWARTGKYKDDPLVRGMDAMPGTLLGVYQRNRIQFQMALDRLYRAHKGESLDGRGRIILSEFDLILSEMESLMTAIVVDNRIDYSESIIAISKLSREVFQTFNQLPRGPQPGDQEKPASKLGVWFWSAAGILLIFMAALRFAGLNREKIIVNWENYVQRSRNFAQEFNKQFLQIKAQYLVFVPLGAGVILGMVAFTAHPIFLPVFSFGGAWVGYKLPGWVLETMRQRRGRQVEAQLIDSMVLMTNALKSGLDIIGAFTMVQRDMLPPISEEFGLVLKNYELGTPFERCLEGLEERAASKLVTYMVRAVIIQRQVGGNLTKIFDRIVENIREEGKLQEKTQSMTAQQRMQSKVVGIMPWAMTGIMFAFQPQQMMEFYTSNVGLGVMLFCIVWIAIGMKVVSKMGEIDV
ncbi:MAG: hypothetical protein A3G41_06440 [Elusimicrobia bacterium RIFCSPLOWO2_12_FULL_59_9]|nr:MAG: hypothetical protein A3G41_06440 [Elusimicrobia bacterium RIFCSPLOWO2_12_FULL_59_9]